VNRDVATVLFTALVATANPSLLAAVTVMALLPHPKRLMLGYLLGAYTTSVVAGLLIVYSLHGSRVVSTSTQLLSPAGEIIVGASALIVAFLVATGRAAAARSWRRKHVHSKPREGLPREPWQARMLQRGGAGVTFVVGAAMSFPGVGYVNALDHIAHLNPPAVSLVLLVLYFCVMQQVLLEGALLVTVFAEDRAQDLIGGFRAWLTGHGRILTTVGLAAVGGLLAARGVLTIG
jgi:Sap, sulfolipid-1-addressing protein